MQNRTFDPGGSKGHLRACPFLGSWRALLCREIVRVRAAGDELQRFQEEIPRLFEARPASMLWQNKSHAVDGGSRLKDARGDRLLGNATVVEERRGASSLTATSRRGFPFSGHRLHGQHTPRQLQELWYYPDFNV